MVRLPQRVRAVLEGTKARFAASAADSHPSTNQVTLYLTNGGVVTGEMVHETPRLKQMKGFVDLRAELIALAHRLNY